MSHHLSRENCKPRAGIVFDVKGERYELAGDLGNGAVGVVRKDTCNSNDSLVAVKFLAPDPKYIDESVFEDVAARFKREGERGVKLQHANLVKIFAYVENSNGEAFEDGFPSNPFILMERINGKTLDSYIRKKLVADKGKFKVTRDRLHIAIQVVNAVSDLHRSRLIHRDIKPANIFMLQNDVSALYPLVKLGDFGIVKWGDFHASISTGVLTMTNQKDLGTLKYMSPEQAISPKDITTRSDIYSLGITMFELFTGQILISPHHVFEVMNARLSRGTTVSRYQSMGYAVSGEDEAIANMILDMHLRGASGRPNIDKVKGILEHTYETRYGSDWESDTNWSTVSKFADDWDD
ncbi:hypothetical protein BH24ACI3_BH24ACI3_15370 [soil metagenome]